MLGKLLKHEFRATAKFFIPLFLVPLVLTPITRILTNLSFQREGLLSAIPIIFSVVYVFALIFVEAVAIVLIAYRFYKNMVTEEGYLTHTLPVSASMHVTSKLIVSFFWIVLSIMVIVISLFGFFYTPERWNYFWKNISSVLSEFSSAAAGTNLQSVLNLFIFEWIVLAVFGALSTILFIYCSICIGQVLFKNHRLLGAILSGVGLNIVISTATSMASFPFILSFGKKSEEITRQMEGVYSNSVYLKQGEQIFRLFTNYLMPYFLFLTLLLSAGYFIVSVLITKNHLNLE